MVYRNAPVLNNGVKTQKAIFASGIVQWQRCRDVIAGVDAVKAAGELYLPRLKSQKLGDYSAYKTRANFFNATGRTHSGLVGMIFRKPPKATLPSAALLTTYLQNVDLNGNPLDVFAREIVEEILSVGNFGLLVDFPMRDTTQQITVADAEQLNLRPSLKGYCREKVINWRYGVVNNAKSLVMVVLEENVEFKGDKDEFAINTQDQWRVLDIDENGSYRIRVFINKDGKDELLPGYPQYPAMNGQTLKFIPFQFVAEEDDIEPPLLDLVDVNLSHYRTSASYENGCHFTGSPTMYVFGYNVTEANGKPSPIYVGSETAIVLTNPDATAGFIEFKGEGLGALEKNLDRKETQMALLGARIIANEKKGVEAADTANIHRVGENSVLADISIEVSMAITQCLKWFVDWMGLSNVDIDYELNRDFAPVALDGPTLTAYIGALQAGAISEEELFDLLQRGDLIDPEVTFDEHKGEVAAFAQQKLAEQEQQLVLTQKYASKPNTQPNS